MTRQRNSDQFTQMHINQLASFAEQAVGRERLKLMVRQLRHGSSLTMPAVVISDGRDTPSMVLVAGQHGDEWNGPWILHELATALEPSDVQGTIVILPIANPLAFNEARRVSAVDNVDLNRTYGAGKPRKPTEHLGELLWNSMFSQTDYLIDIHSGGPGEYLPFAAAPNGVDLELARALNLHYIHLPGQTEAGFLVNACQQSGVHAVLIEVGGGRTLDRQYHQTVMNGLMNAMRTVGILAGSPKSGPEAYIFKRKDIVPAPCPGFFNPEVELGQSVQAGDRLGVVTPILADKGIDILAPRAGTLIYIRRELSVGEYDSLVHIV